MARRQIEIDNRVAAELAGAEDAILRALEKRLVADVFLRGNVLTLDGEAEAVATGSAVIRELGRLVEGGHALTPGTVDAVAGALAEHESPARILEDVVWRHRNLRVAPKSVNQKRYVDAIRRDTVTFGIGPAGTGKTFLAIAMAVAALSRREVNRIILTRPAVEAGERLGFLPGDLMAKVDPYLRPLFDALHDMLDADRVSQHLEKNVIEVAPLAFMRGRAQPVDTPVLTPAGWQPIGELRVGDLVVGANGLPTPVLGVYPQGRKEVFRLAAQDGASTLCCAEHLWHVFTASDRRRGKPGRVLETRQMIGRLRTAHEHRFELPLVSSPVEFEPHDVPMDPYALGLLLGDGFGSSDTVEAPSRVEPEPDPAMLERGGALATATPRPVGGRSSTRFIPASYLHNSAAVRHALLQGLLDSDGGSVSPDGRLHFMSFSERLRGDVIFVVESLGGIVDRREQRGASMDIRLPNGVEPFRLERKRVRYREHGGGRPMRFVHSIEPAGEAETVCIQVGAADSLYVTEDFLVTHNTLNDSFIILDEAQNTSPEQMKMFLTRLGFGSKMVVTGDVTQVDLPRDHQSGLIVVSEILTDVDGVSFVRFGGEDVVRHKLVQRIVAAYDEHAARQAPELRAAEKHRRRHA